MRKRQFVGDFWYETTPTPPSTLKKLFPRIAKMIKAKDGVPDFKFENNPTNHSVRATMIQTLLRQNFPAAAVAMKVIT
jgi:hypothetical protein